MTTAEQFRAAVAHPTSNELSIAGVPWPAYKVVAVIIGLLILALVGVLTTSAAAAVLTAAAAATVSWLGLGYAHRIRG